MPHVELSLSDDPGHDPDQHAARGPWADPPAARQSSVPRWADVVADAAEPCVVLDADGVIVACSPACLTLLGRYESQRGPETTGDTWIGRGLLDVLHLVDLTGDSEPLAPWESERVPPLLALATGSLARGVMRLRIGDTTRTVDAVSTPLRDGPATAGSLTFLHPL